MTSQPLETRLRLFNKLLKWFVQRSSAHRNDSHSWSFSADKNYTCLDPIAKAVIEKVDTDCFSKRDIHLRLFSVNDRRTCHIRSIHPWLVLCCSQGWWKVHDQDVDKPLDVLFLVLWIVVVIFFWKWYCLLLIVLYSCMDDILLLAIRSLRLCIVRSEGVVVCFTLRDDSFHLRAVVELQTEQQSHS